ncbi:MAG TPA: sulfatase-like hydrolase/transferase [Candidatus Aminicenantes bacterium]|nr:sulfatase-like hydrolase/transferase [Candidatus Aminicenantes bacterium]
MNEKSPVPVVVIALFVLTLLVFLPAVIYLTNSEEFTNGLFELLAVGLGLALAVGLLLWLLLRLLRLLGRKPLEKGIALLFALALLLWLQGNVLLWNYGPLDGRSIPWESMKPQGFIDLGLWLTLLAAAFLFSSFVARHARKISWFLILIQLGYGAALFVRQPERPSFQRYTVDTASQFSFSRNRNVIIVVLDSFPADVFAEVIRENPDLASGFDGFTFYRNSLGGYATTELSVALLLTGRFYDNSLPFEPWKREAYLGNSLPRVLLSAGWRVDVFPKVSYSLYYSDQVASNFVPGVPLVERMLDIFQIYDLTLFRCLPHFFKPRVYNEQAWLLKRIGFGLLGTRFQEKRVHKTRVSREPGRIRMRDRHRFGRKAFRFSADVRFVTEMLLNAALTDAKGAFKYYHLGVPHLPLLLDADLKYRRADPNRQNYKAYAAAGVKLMAVFLERLQEIGAYDNSLVLILGDHGAGGQQQEFVIQPGMENDPAKHLVRERYRISAMPLVLLKPVAARGALAVSDAPVSHADVPATVFHDLGLTIDSPGIPMTTLVPGAVRERRFMSLSGRDIFSYYQDMTEFIVTGPGWFDESWRPSGRVYSRSGVKTLKR